VSLLLLTGSAVAAEPGAATDTVSTNAAPWETPEADMIFPVPIEPPDGFAEPSDVAPTEKDLNGDLELWFVHAPKKNAASSTADVSSHISNLGSKLLEQSTNANMQRLLGYWYDIHTNFDQALTCYDKAADQGDHVATIMAWNIREILNSLGAAQKGDAEAQFAVGNGYLTRGYIGEAARWFSEAAKLGHAESKERMKEIEQFRVDAKMIQLFQTTSGPEWSGWTNFGEYRRRDLGDAMERIARFVGYSAADTVEGRRWFERANVLRLSYQNGKSTLEDARQIAKTPSWFSKLCELQEKALKGSQNAQIMLGANLISVKDNSGTGLRWIQEAANAGNPGAELILAELYEKGDSVPKDLKRTLKWSEAAATNSIDYAPIADLRVKVATMYRDGLAGEKKPTEAMKWFLRAADTGENDSGREGALFLLGTIFRDGVLVKRDPTESDKWMTKAAEADSTLAKCFLGQEFRQGNVFIEIDTNFFTDILDRPAPTNIRKEVRNWLFKEAQSGNRVAEYALGVAYAWEAIREEPSADGSSEHKPLSQEVTENYRLGTNWLSKALQHGESRAAAELGRMYEYGWGVEENARMAAKYYEQAAERGHVEAIMHLARLYRRGDGVPKNAAEAARLYLEKPDNEDAQLAMGEMTRDGEGVPQNYVEAYAWFNIASASGNAYAQRERDKLAQVLPPEQLAEAQRRSETYSKQGSVTGRKNAKTSEGVLQDVQATGTGFFITADGVLVTCAHVVKGANRISVMKGNQAFDAKILRMDRANDIAILKAEGNFQPLPVGSSKGAKLGESVFTIGFPNTQLQGIEPKFTRGEINSLAGIQDDVRFFQISVPVQPGNSGGPLLNSRGEVVGIVTSRLSDAVTLDATGSLPQNVNYALKSSFLEAALENIPHTFRETGGSSKTLSLDEITKPALDSTVLILVY
jgi:TPR repeat protein